MSPSDSRPEPLTELCIPRRRCGFPAPRRASQVPRPSFRCAPSPITPESPAAAFIRSFTAGAGFIQSGRLATLISVTRPERVHLRCGSHLCPGGASHQSDYSDLRPLGYMSTDHSHGGHLSAHKFGQACPGAPDFADGADRTHGFRVVGAALVAALRRRAAIKVAPTGTTPRGKARIRANRRTRRKRGVKQSIENEPRIPLR